MFPSTGSAGRRFASLHRVLRGEFPCFSSTIKALRLPAAHPAALRCLRLAVPQRFTRWVRSPADECTAGAWSWSPGVSSRVSPRKRQDPPKFLGNPNCPFAHVPTTPAGLLAPDRFTVQQRGPRYMNSEGSHERSFDAQWHGFRTRCVRFAVRVTHAPRNTRFRPLVRRCRTGFPPAGFR